jgi:hypothetical protein
MNNPNPYNCQKEIYKNWIKRRFTSEIDLQNMPTDLALIWCDALRELSQSVTHQIIPFRRPKSRRASGR